MSEYIHRLDSAGIKHMIKQLSLEFDTRGRGTYEITEQVQRLVAESGFKTGLCHLFLHHTSASIILCENADPSVRQDLETYMARLVTDGDRLFSHRDEGPDDMAAHLRSILTQAELNLPIESGRCALGTWQGIYLWEHRLTPHRRRLTLTLLGE